MTVMCFDALFSFWISVTVIKNPYHEIVARDTFLLLLECCDFSACSVWSWAPEAPLLDRHLACQCGCFPSGTLSPCFCWLPEGVLRNPLPLSLLQAFWCWVCVLHFIRLNKLINSADSERLHNLSNVNSHLNYPNFILNLQNPITS